MIATATTAIPMAAYIPALRPLLSKLTLKVFLAIPNELVNWHVNSSPSLLKFDDATNFRLVHVLLIFTPSLSMNPYLKYI